MENAHLKVDGSGSVNPTVKLGFIPLIDCAPFVIAHEKGYFSDENIDVILSKEASWASIRDKVVFNLLDGAHMLASMPLASTLGLGTIRMPMQTSFTVSQNGNGITVSNALYKSMQSVASGSEQMRNGVALSDVIKQRSKTQGALRFAIVYPYSSHNYQLRSWLSNAGIHPDYDVQLVVVPPTQMMQYLSQGEIDGYCVGEPWNSLAVEKGVGHMLVTGYELWGNTPEKVFGVNTQWAESHPDTHAGLIRALYKACQWVDDSDHQEELLEILSQSEYLNCPVSQLQYGFGEIKPSGFYDWPMNAYQTFSGKQLNKPNKHYAFWILGQMYRWQQLARTTQLTEVVNMTFRQDLYCQALQLDYQPEPDLFHSVEEELTWLQEIANEQIIIHPEGIDKGFVYHKVNK